MNQEISIIHENPLAVLVALDTCRQLAQLSYSLVDFVANGASLPGISDRTDHKKVSERRDRAKIEYL